MPDIVIEGPDGNEYVFPEGTSKEAMRAAMRKRFPKPPKKKEPVSRTEAVVSGFERGLRPVGDIMRQIDPVSNIVNYFFPSVEEKRKQSTARAAEFAQRAEADRPGYFLGGKIAGEVAGTAPLVVTGGAGIAATGGRLARAGGQMVAAGTKGGRAVQKVGRATQAAGRAVQTGGVGVRAPTRTAVAGKAPIAATRKGRMALRVGGGTAAGAAGAVLNDQEIADAAMAGAVIPLVGTISRRGLGFVYDVVRQRVGEVRAAEILRNLIASDASAITNALREAPENARANTAEFLASRDLLTPELAAATRIAAASTEGAPLLRVAQARAAGQEELRTALRGGETGTEAMQNIGAMRQQVGEVTGPMREEALRLADVGRTQILPAEQQAAALRDAAAEEARRAARFYGAADERATYLGQLDDIGDPFSAEAMNMLASRQRSELARLEPRGLAMGQRSVDLGAAARSAEEVAANLRAQGLQPLDISGVVGNLRQRAADAEFVNPPRFRLLNEFANNLERRAATQGGVIDATGLYELRKSMADTVADLLGPMDPGALQRRTAELVGETKPLIDDAIEAAGGANWRQYLNTFAAGMQNVERQEFARVLEKLPAKRIQQIVTGKDPDFVSNFFGPGRYDVNVELFGSQLPVAQRLASEIGQELDVAAGGLRAMPAAVAPALRAGVRSRVEEMFQPGMKNMFARLFLRGRSGAAGGAGGANLAVDQIASNLARQIQENAMRRLAPALANPQEAARLLGQQSTANQLADMVNRVPGSIPLAAAQAAQRFEAAPPAFPEVDLPGGDMPFGNINYDEFGNYIGPRR
jgi:hypothetical protein